MYWGQLIHAYKENYFTSFFATLVAFVAYFVIRKKGKSLPGILPLYLLIFGLHSLGYDVSALLIKRPYSRTIFAFELWRDIFFTLFEFYVFFDFVRRIISNHFRKKVVDMIGCIYYVLSVGLIVSNLVQQFAVFDRTVAWCYGIQAICILVICVIYYAEIFALLLINELDKDPSFWVVTGLSFFMVCTLPITILINHDDPLTRVYETFIYAIFHVFYCFLFAMIIKAYSCIPATTK